MILLTPFAVCMWLNLGQFQRSFRNKIRGLTKSIRPVVDHEKKAVQFRGDFGHHVERYSRDAKTHATTASLSEWQVHGHEKAPGDQQEWVTCH